MTLNDSTELIDARREDSGLFDLQKLSGAPTRSGNTQHPSGSAEPSGLIRLEHLAHRSRSRRAQPPRPEPVTPAPMAPVGYRRRSRLASPWLWAAVTVSLMGVVGALVAIEPEATSTPPTDSELAAHQPSRDFEEEPTEQAHAEPPVETRTLDTAALTRVSAHAAVQGMGVASLARERAAAFERLVGEPTRTASPNGRPSRPEHEPSRTETIERTETADPTPEGTSEEPDALSVLLERTRRPQSQTPEAAERTPAEPLANELSVGQISRTMRSARPQLAACRDQAGLPRGQRLRIDVRLTIGANGRVASTHSDSDSAATACVLDVVRDIAFEATSGEGTTLTYPVIIR